LIFNSSLLISFSYIFQLIFKNKYTNNLFYEQRLNWLGYGR
jgi:hypothetical protein